MVFLNALSGSVAYARMRRINYASGLTFAACTMAHGLRRAAWLGAGAVVGAQIGARRSERAQGKWIVRGLAVGLVFVGVRILWLAF